MKLKRFVLVPLAAVSSVSAFAQATGTAASQVTAKVTEGLSQGETIAVAIVVGLFAIWAIKLLWKSK